MGLAILSTFAANRTANVLSGVNHATHQMVMAAQLDGYHVAFACGAALMAAALVLELTLLRKHHVASIDVTMPVAEAAA